MPKASSPTLSIASSSNATNQPGYIAAEQLLIEFSQNSAPDAKSTESVVYTPICNLSQSSATAEITLSNNLLIINNYATSFPNHSQLIQTQDLLDLLQQHQEHPAASKLSEIIELRRELLVSQNRFAEAIQLTTTLTDPPLLLYTRYLIGREAYEKAYFDEAKQCLEECVQLIETRPDANVSLDRKIQIHAFLANIYGREPNHTQLALTHCEKTIAYINQCTNAKSNPLTSTKTNQTYIYAQMQSLLIKLHSNTGNVSDANKEKIKALCNELITHSLMVLTYPRSKNVFSPVEMNDFQVWQNTAKFIYAIALLEEDEHYDVATTHIEATRFFSSLLKYQKDIRANHAIGITLVREGKYHSALNCFLDAFDQGFDVAALGLTICYAHLENFAEAIAWLTFAKNNLPPPQISQNHLIKILYTLTFNTVLKSFFSWSLQYSSFSANKPINEKTLRIEEDQQQQFQRFESLLRDRYSIEYSQNTEGNPLSLFSPDQKMTIQHIFNGKAESITIHSLVSLLHHPFFENKVTLKKTDSGFNILILQNSAQPSTSASTSETLQPLIGKILDQNLIRILASILTASGIRKVSGT